MKKLEVKDAYYKKCYNHKGYFIMGFPMGYRDDYTVWDKDQKNMIGNGFKTLKQAKEYIDEISIIEISPIKIEIRCSKIQYERIIDAGKSYFKNNQCFIGKNYKLCPTFQKNGRMFCDECLRENIKRIG